MDSQKKFLAGSKQPGSTLKSTTTPGQPHPPNSKPSDPKKTEQPKNDKNADREMSSEERLADFVIHAVERERLDKVFKKMSTACLNKKEEDKDYITADDIAKILQDLKFKMLRSEIDLMIWVGF
jgi:hypothetical protein